MKVVVFPYYVNFGGGDSVDAEVEVKLSEKDYQRLVKSANAVPRWHLDEDDEIVDIYRKVYAAIVKQNKIEFQEDPELIEDFLEDYDDYEEGMKITTEMVEEYLDQFIVGITYPEEFRDKNANEEDDD